MIFIYQTPDFLGFSQAKYYIVISRQASLKQWLFCRNNKDAGEYINSLIPRRIKRQGYIAKLWYKKHRSLYSLPLYNRNQPFKHSPVVLISQKNPIKQQRYQDSLSTQNSQYLYSRATYIEGSITNTTRRAAGWQETTRDQATLIHAVITFPQHCCATHKPEEKLPVPLP